VKASDFRYTIERDFKIDSPGVGFFSSIKGVSGPNGFAETKKGHISGIITDDAARTIEIQLDHPEGDILYILALEFANFVPAGTPASDQSTHPIPATGPYMLESYTPNRSFTLVRNPNYNNQIPTMPSGAPDKVVGTIITDPVASYQQVVSGKADYDYNQVRTTAAGGAVQVQGPAADLHEREYLVLLPQQQDPTVQQHQGP
jgi:peptide/nickel transport system substrate-binding protein